MVSRQILGAYSILHNLFLLKDVFASTPVLTRLPKGLTYKRLASNARSNIEAKRLSGDFSLLSAKQCIQCNLGELSFFTSRCFKAPSSAKKAFCVYLVVSNWYWNPTVGGGPKGGKAGFSCGRIWGFPSRARVYWWCTICCWLTHLHLFQLRLIFIYPGHMVRIPQVWCFLYIGSLHLMWPYGYGNVLAQKPVPNLGPVSGDDIYHSFINRLSVVCGRLNRTTLAHPCLNLPQRLL